MKRRNWLAASVAVGAGLAGAGWAWWRHRPVAAQPAAVAGLWQQSWDDPNGGSIAMAAFRGQPLLLNFWATWCPPCVEELPMLDAFHQQFRAQGWQVLGLAVDQPSAVRRFLGRQPLSFPVGLAGLDGTELSRQLGNPNGGLPFSVLIGRQGQLLERKVGQLKAADLERWRQLA